MTVVISKKLNTPSFFPLLYLEKSAFSFDVDPLVCLSLSLTLFVSALILSVLFFRGRPSDTEGQPADILGHYLILKRATG